MPVPTGALAAREREEPRDNEEDAEKRLRRLQMCELKDGNEANANGRMLNQREKVG